MNPSRSLVSAALAVALLAGPTLAQVATPSATPAFLVIRASKEYIAPGETVQIYVRAPAGAVITCDIGSHTNLPFAGGNLAGDFHCDYKILADDHFRNQSMVCHMHMPTGGPTISMPVPTTLTVVVKLELTSLTVSPSGPYKPGSSISVTVTGTPGSHVAADVGGRPTPLRETSAGSYSGSLTLPQSGTNLHVHATLAIDTRSMAKDSSTLYLDTSSH